jgi:hypothetical protein
MELQGIPRYNPVDEGSKSRSRPIAKLGTLKIQTVYTKLSEAGLSPRTIAYTQDR